MAKKVAQNEASAPKEQFNSQVYVDDNMRLVKNTQWLETLENLNELYTHKMLKLEELNDFEKLIEAKELKLKVLNIRSEIVAQKRNISEMEFRVRDYEKKFNRTLELARHELPNLIEEGKLIVKNKKNASQFVPEIKFVIDAYDDVMGNVDIDKLLDAIKPDESQINHRKHMMATYRALKIAIDSHRKLTSK